MIQVSMFKDNETITIKFRYGKPKTFRKDAHWSDEDSLYNAKMIHSLCSGIDFSGLDLRYADFYKADVSNCNFNGCNLHGADFESANITGATFEGAILTRCNFKTVQERNKKDKTYV